jgi:hypothetical protein
MSAFPMKVEFPFFVFIEIGHRQPQRHDGLRWRRNKRKRDSL